MSTATMPDSTLELDADTAEALDARLREAEAALPPEEATSEPETDSEAQALAELSGNTGDETQVNDDDNSGTRPADEAQGADTTPGETKPADEGKPQSKYAKEQERRDRSWKALNEAKSTFEQQQAAAQAKLEADRKAFAEEQAQWQEYLQKAQEPKFKPEDYEAAAVKWDEQGLLDQADAARNEAQRLRVELAERAKHPPADPLAQAKAQFAQAQRASAAKAKEELPALAQDTPERKAFVSIMEQHPELMDKVPDSPRLVARFIKAETAARRVPELEAQVKTLTQKNQELEQLVSVSGGGPASMPSGEKPFEAMTIEEQGAALRRELDAQR